MFTQGKGWLSYLLYGWGGWGRKSVTLSRHTGGLCSNWDCIWKDWSWHIHSAEEITRWRQHHHLDGSDGCEFSAVKIGQIMPVCRGFTRLYLQNTLQSLDKGFLSKCSQRLDKIIASPSSSSCKKSCWFPWAEGSASCCSSACKNHPAEHVLTTNKSPKCSGWAENLITYRNRACRERTLRGPGSLCACGAVCITKDALHVYMPAYRFPELWLLGES